nr:GNAT family N-acetyltransferase [Parabacteroides goldsteinii]
MNFFEKTGKMAIGSRLRMLTDKITVDATSIYKMYGINLKPKWFPVFFILSQGEAMAITSIAKEIGHSHPSVSNIVKEMQTKGLVKEIADKTDKRKNLIALSTKGKQMSEILAESLIDVTTAIDDISKETRNDLWKAIGEWEDLLSEKSLLQRVKDAKKIRENKDIQIIPYGPSHQPIFKSLNENWITSHWELEAHDLEILDYPQENILDKGGYIFVATYKGEPVGVCSLCKMNDSIYDYELAKLAVTPDIHGKGIGRLLCEAVINQAKELGATKIFLESNTLLKPAINLYRKLGFKEVAEYHPLYARGDIQMELTIK